MANSLSQYSAKEFSNFSTAGPRTNDDADTSLDISFSMSFCIGLWSAERSMKGTFFSDCIAFNFAMDILTHTLDITAAWHATLCCCIESNIGCTFDRTLLDNCDCQRSRCWYGKPITL